MKKQKKPALIINRTSDDSESGSAHTSSHAIYSTAESDDITLAVPRHADHHQLWVNEDAEEDSSRETQPLLSSSVPVGGSSSTEAYESNFLRRNHSAESLNSMATQHSSLSGGGGTAHSSHKSPGRKPYAPERHTLNGDRFKFYTRLNLEARKQGHQDEDFLQPPDSVLPPELFLVTLPWQQAGTKQSSLVTIFSIWNTMIGSTLLTMPWAFSEAGLGTSLGLCLLLAFISCFTCIIILNIAKTGGYADFMEMATALIGKWARWVGLITSLLVLVGACIAYHVLMSQSLWSVVVAFAPNAPSWWTDAIATVMIVPVLLGLTAIREFTVLAKLNSLGILCVLYVLGFLIGRPISMVVEQQVGFQYIMQNIPEFQSTFPKLAGVLAVAFFIHNAILTIVQYNKHQENNVRDVTVAFVLVAFCYAIPGAVAYTSLTFTSHHADLQQNVLRNFLATDTFAIVARVVLFFQLLTVFPVLCFVIRKQVWGSIAHIANPSLFRIVLLNAVVITITSVFSAFFPQIGDVLRFIGAFAGLVYVYGFPVIMDWRLRHRQHQLGKFRVFIGILFLTLGLAVTVAQFIYL